MKATPGTIVRLGGLVLLAVVLQVAGVATVRVFGATPDVVPLAIGAVGLLGGSVPAALTGFASGLLLDLAVGQPLGASSLVLTAVGYGVGRYSEVRDPSHGLLPIPVGAAATAGYVVGFAALSFMLEVRGPVSPSVIREMIITILLNALLALLIFPIIRRFMRPVLVGDLRERHRPRTATTGPLGLRGLEI
ncbi:MAG: rod shape-determining protein MreD [Thermoleophilaceae bacterium]